MIIIKQGAIYDNGNNLCDICNNQRRIHLLGRRTLHKNGRLFLVKSLNENGAIADSINHLLLVGFYLVNFGFISLALQYGTKPQNVVEVIEFLSTKIGLAIVVLGIMHFFNMGALILFRKCKYSNGMVAHA